MCFVSFSLVCEKKPRRGVGKRNEEEREKKTNIIISSRIFLIRKILLLMNSNPSGLERYCLLAKKLFKV